MRGAEHNVAAPLFSLLAVCNISDGTFQSGCCMCVMLIHITANFESDYDAARHLYSWCCVVAACHIRAAGETGASRVLIRYRD